MTPKVYNNAWEWLYDDKTSFLDEEAKTFLDDIAVFLAHLHAITRAISIRTVAYIGQEGFPEITASKHDGRTHKKYGSKIATFWLKEMPDGKKLWSAKCGFIPVGDQNNMSEEEAIQFARSYFCDPQVDQEWLDQKIKEHGEQEHQRLGQFLVNEYKKLMHEKDLFVHPSHTEWIFHKEDDTETRRHDIITQFKRRFVK